MTQIPVLVDLDSANVGTFPCCGIKNAGHEGRCNKIRWLKAQFRKGLRARMLVTPDGRPCGYIEYIPGEYAWRGVDAAGYMFIHCVWSFYRRYQHRGLGARMINACLEDAASAGMHGVAVVVRERPWLAGPTLFRANGFDLVDTAPPDYQLLVRKLDPSAPNPSFKGEWEDKLAKYRRGLTIILSHQCPHIAKFAAEIAQSAQRDYRIKPRVVEIRSHREAQNAPTPYAVFAVLYNGRILADHQISLTRFRNIMRHLTA
jgi:GNAT superfamily N-acetyltransferase